MIYVVCFFVGGPWHGVRLDTSGSKWQVHFHAKTMWVDSNRCNLESKP